jgi:hypothetical protein
VERAPGREETRTEVAESQAQGPASGLSVSWCRSRMGGQGAGKGWSCGALQAIGRALALVLIIREHPWIAFTVV